MNIILIREGGEGQYPQNSLPTEQSITKQSAYRTVFQKTVCLQNCPPQNSLPTVQFPTKQSAYRTVVKNSLPTEQSPTK